MSSAPWPVALTTARLHLRPIEAADVPAVSRLWTDPAVRRYLGGPVPEETVRARERGCVGAFGAFGVVLRADGTVVGGVLLEPDSRHDGRTEVSYQLLPEHWGHGYGREAVWAAVSWAFDALTPGRPEVVAVTQEANAPSRRLLEALGMRQVDAFTEFGAPQVMYALTRDPDGQPRQVPRT
ncbi:GNAT family N-acetyltransferase [Streptomyces coffeae]|uniref:GNAT family N-acetyltransferase n=1 Tax=Streptomyces coffeae TaxID=621382 RepID=A0ABS1NAZ0_9ACTN|nr:GNAT family N-acetyltransferase [Streptomyces coffeae]MBL1097079.1 GNAT family N-acetyltransferase [Streptomyces coffeae]